MMLLVMMIATMVMMITVITRTRDPEHIAEGMAAKILEKNWGAMLP